MGIFGRIFGSGKKQPQEKPPERDAAATQSASGTDRLTYEKAADFSAILQYCSAKEKEGRDWPSPNLLRQLREVLRDAPIRNASPASVSLTRQLPALWKGREDLMVTETLQFTRSLTGDFAAVVDEIMDKIGRAEKVGVFVSLHREPDLGVTVNGHVVEGVFSLLTVKLPSSRFAVYSCLQQDGNDAAARRALDRFSELLSMSRTDFQQYLDADFEGIKANMVQLARGGKTMEFLAESSRKRADEISETAAEVLVSEPAFAETLAKQIASTYTFVKEAGKAAGSRYAANDPLRKMAEKMGAEDLFADTLGEVRAKNAGPVMDMGRAAHLLMRAMRRDPKLGNRTAILDSLRQVEHAGDPFVSGNAVEALKLFREASQSRPASGSQPRSETSSHASANPVQQSSSPAEVTTLIQWVGLTPPKELQALEEKPRLENLTVLMQNTVNTVTNTFKRLHDWNVQMVRDGSSVTFSCQCPDSLDPLQVRTFLNSTWDECCKEDSRLRREREWATWIKFAELVSSLDHLAGAHESIKTVWNGTDARIELIMEALSQIERADGKRGARRLRLTCPESRKAKFHNIVIAAFGPEEAAGILEDQ